MPLLTGQLWRVLKSWHTGGGPEQRFRRCYAEGLKQQFQQFSSVCGAG